MIVFDPSAFAKKGTKSVGVARQWCGRLGKVENCQVGIYMAYVSRNGTCSGQYTALSSRGMDEGPCPVQGGGSPRRRSKFRTRHELALEMLTRAAIDLPHGWVAGDDEMGRPASFRRDLSGLGERYLLAVPSNTLIRDHGGRHRRSTRDAAGIP